MIKTRGGLVAVLVYGVFSIATLLLWHTMGVNTVTGDEIHYLVMSSGIVKNGSLEQTAPYREEFKAREIYKHGIAPEDAQPSPENTHAVLGPNGLFNVHSIGLPLLLAIPFMIGGVFGAKVFMVFVGALVVVCASRVSSCFSENKSHRVWAIIAATISLPLIPASNQVYPDILAGLIALVGLYWFITIKERRSPGLEALMAATIAYLPWLQVKFAATCAILVLAVTVKIYLETKDVSRGFRILLIAGVSCLMLAAYNYYAFGEIFGPYQSSALEISKTSLMVFIGLLIDQNQGLFLQNPINLIGIMAIGWLYRTSRAFTLTWSLVFLSLIVPNALHPNWYGGGSFSGRFQWSAAMVLIIPVVFGLLAIAGRNEKGFRLLVASGLSLQLYCFYRYAIMGVDLYNKGAETWFDAYPIFYYPLHGWLPMLYNSRWAYGYWPNSAWVLLIGTLFLFGMFGKDGFYKKTGGKVVVSVSSFVILSSVVLAGLSNNRPKEEVVFRTAQLPSQTGRSINLHRVAEPNVDHPGLINFGPYFPLRKGSYEVVFSYKSAAAASATVGWVDVFNATSGVRLVQSALHGTSNVADRVKVKFESTQWKLNLFEFRTYWNGASDLEVLDISLRTE